MNRGDTFIHQGVTYTVINILEDGKIEGRAFTTPGPGSPPVQEIIIAEGDITP
jgi:hypothetical protein